MTHPMGRWKDIYFPSSSFDVFMLKKVGIYTYMSHGDRVMGGECDINPKKCEQCSGFLPSFKIS